MLKDITERKRAEEKYRTLVSNVQEGVFISTPAGRFLDFNDALMRMLGYEHRDELLSVDIPAMYVNNSRPRAIEEAACRSMARWPTLSSRSGGAMGKCGR